MLNRTRERDRRTKYFYLPIRHFESTTLLTYGKPTYDTNNDSNELGHLSTCAPCRYVAKLDSYDP